MKIAAPFSLLIAGMFAAGCAAQNEPFSPTFATNVTPAMIVTPDNSIAGKVVLYNSGGRFMVLNFPAGQMPKMDQILFLYRAGLKTAEVKITGPQGYGNIVADLLTGDAQAGDEVRDK
jgi:hypothetical protein